MPFPQNFSQNPFFNSANAVAGFQGVPQAQQAIAIPVTKDPMAVDNALGPHSYNNDSLRDSHGNIVPPIIPQGPAAPTAPGTNPNASGYYGAYGPGLDTLYGQQAEKTRLELESIKRQMESPNPELGQLGGLEESGALAPEDPRWSQLQAGSYESARRHYLHALMLKQINPADTEVSQYANKLQWGADPKTMAFLDTQNQQYQQMLKQAKFLSQQGASHGAMAVPDFFTDNTWTPTYQKQRALQYWMNQQQNPMSFGDRTEMWKNLSSMPQGQIDKYHAGGYEPHPTDTNPWQTPMGFQGDNYFQPKQNGAYNDPRNAPIIANPNGGPAGFGTTPPYRGIPQEVMNMYPQGPGTPANNWLRKYTTPPSNMIQQVNPPSMDLLGPQPKPQGYPGTYDTIPPGPNYNNYPQPQSYQPTPGGM